jgi:IS30 family transposase
MKQYSRVSYAIRCQIHAYFKMKIPIREISILVGVHKSTIYRELKRNYDFLSGCYEPEMADYLAQRRYKQCRKRYIITGQIKQIIKNCLQAEWSPQQISGRLKLEKGEGLSHQTIYNYIYHAGLKGHLRKNGRRGAGRYLQRKRIRRDVLTFAQRPQVANQRKRIGDWERDTMHTLNGNQILVCVDRKSRLTKMRRVKTRTTLAVGDLTEKPISETNKKAYPITNDNGGDFKGRSRMKLKTYFCDPLKPQQRGKIENTIGLIRQYIAALEISTSTSL